MKTKTLALATLLAPLLLANSARAKNTFDSDSITSNSSFFLKQQLACQISGQIYGISSQSSSSLSIVIFNPNSGKALGKFPVRPDEAGQPNYAIGLRQPGYYLLRVFRDQSGSLYPVRTSPSQRLIACSNSTIQASEDFVIE